MPVRHINAQDIVTSIADALQFISYYHPADFVRALRRAYDSETSAPARNALLQLLVNSRMSATGHRPVCQDTGVAHVFVRMGMDVRVCAADGGPTPSLQALANRAVAQAYGLPANPLRASMIRAPLGDRRNTGDNTPAVVHVTLTEGDTLDLIVVAKGGGGDVKARYAMLNPSDSVADWIVDQIPGMGAGWCPPGVLGVGVGGSPEQAMLMAKRSLFSPIDIHDLRARGPADELERLRLTLYDRINALGIGAQGLGGDTTVLDVKIEQASSHAALLPVAILPNCAATRYASLRLDGSGPASLSTPDPSLWDGIPDHMPLQDGVHVDLDTLSAETVATWRAGDLLLLTGKLLTGRDAAHKRMAECMARGEPLPVDLRGRAIYYVGPVDPVPGEAVGPAGPTTSARMDRFLPALLERTGLLLTIGKAERAPEAIDAIRRAGSAYLMAVGGAAYLVSRAVRAARVVAYEDLGMEAIYEFRVENMPVVVAIDARGRAVHRTVPLKVVD
ncbi:fumarate hydratase [Allopusillimonas soli]|uniref:Fumarate hydratase class I n=1 Tax=Allopusillimonas soli TaxID=659016 RepID=A0A853FBD8_9BURK|nr:fumarate hydratase [Allopusillimonas soli]NYT37239.1 fumarate hydratase [Allopusillimonas soli]TEA74759.1 fumarate hydratase [Allopusillimonas soli]